MSQVGRPRHGIHRWKQGLKAWVGTRLVQPCAVGLVFLFAFVPLRALDPETALNHYVYRYWSNQNGLPQNTIETIAQDRDGFLWLGTQEGAARFDGGEFLVFNKINTPELRESHISIIFATENHEVWFGTYGGGIAVYRDNRFVPGPTHPMLDQARVETIFQDGAGTIFIGTDDRGLFRYRNQTVEHLPTPFEAGLNQICGDGRDGLWLATDGAGLWHFREGIFTRPHQFASVVNCLLRDNRGRLWVGTGSGLFRVQEKPERVYFDETNQDHNFILTLTADRNGNFWMGTRAGLTRYRNGSVEHFSEIGHRPLGQVIHLFEDRDANLWVGGSGAGLLRFSDSTIRTYSVFDGLRNNVVWSIIEGDDDRVRVTTDAGGLDIINEDGTITVQPPLRISQAYLLSVAADGNGGFYISTFSGLYQVSGDEVLRLGGDDERLRNLVFPLFMDRENNLWVDCEAGVFRYRDGNFELFNSGILKTMNVQGFAQAEDDALWIVGDMGMARFEDGEFKMWSGDGGVLPHANVTAVYPEGDRVWLGLDYLGLGLFHRGTIFVFGPEHGLPADMIYGILEDELGFLWFSTTRGVHRVSKQALLEVASQALPRVDVRTFSQADGLRVPECSYGGFPAVYRDSEGMLWFATIGGAAMVNPRTVLPEPSEPKLFIEKVVVDGKTYDPTEKMVFDQGFRSMEIHYTAVEFIQPRQVRFRTKLEGFDQEFEENLSRRTAYFTHLPPGDYNFLVTTQNGTNTAEWAFQVYSPWWRQSFFLVVLILVFLLVVLIRNQVLRSRNMLHVRALARRIGELEPYRERYREEIRQVNLQIESAGTLAAKAEMTTHMLHNIGNVLNSLSVSSSLMEKMLRTTGTHQLVGRIVELVESKRHELGDFFQNNNQGRKVPGALKDIADVLEDGKEALLHENGNLEVQTGHLREIVQAQQDQPRAKSETFDINILVEDAVKMQSHLLRKFNVEVVQTFEPLPPVRGTKSQLLQILVNLIKNAYESIRMKDEPDQRKILLKTYARKDGVVIVEVGDTGVGISEQHMKRLFTHGFTTKPEGHGFGLHYCRNVMREMGGDIAAYSQGEGMGAVFRLEIPG